MPTTNDQRPTTRIGYGFDSHEFRPGIPLKIGGVTLAHDKGLGGHSDGDVLLHAITDALLGAVAAPDIGALFPPSDPQWRGADSVVFLREALKRVRDARACGAVVGCARGLCRVEGEDSGRTQSGKCRGCTRSGAAGEAHGFKEDAAEEKAEENEIASRRYACPRRAARSKCSLHALELTLPLLVSRFCGFDQGLKDRSGGFVRIHGTLGMPLHCQHEVIGDGSFEGFDDAVFEAAG